MDRKCLTMRLSERRRAASSRGATGLCIPSGTSLVLDPFEYLFPMHRDVLRRIHSDADLGAVHAKDRHNDVRTDPNYFAHSPRKYQHVRLHALR